MARGIAPSRETPWVTASDLAEYAFCPRAHYYRHHPPQGGPSLQSEVGARRGVRFHERSLSAIQRRDAHALAWVVLLAVSLIGGTAVLVGWLGGWI